MQNYCWVWSALVQLLDFHCKSTQIHKLFVLYQGYKFKHGEVKDKYSSCPYILLSQKSVYDPIVVLSSKSLSYSVYRMDGTFID